MILKKTGKLTPRGQPKVPEGYRRLFYFTGKDYALQSLRDHRIKVSRFHELNDPFDFLGIALKSSSERIEIDQVKKRLDDTVGLICMAKTWVEPLLWGHYADKHKGICLQFLVRANKWNDINYRNTRPTLETFKKSQVSDLNTEDLRRLSLFKFKQWGYEQEARCFIALNEPDLVTGHYFQRFNDADGIIKLERIILGSRCDVCKSVIDGLAKHNGDNVGVIKARPAHFSFRVIRDMAYNRPTNKRTNPLLTT
jgi:hypothetical protein